MPAFGTLFAAFIGKLPIPSEPTGFPSGRTVARKVIAMAWVRRQFQRTFFNQTPTANPAQISQTASGAVTGDLNAADADADPLTYTVTQAPTHGTVVIDADGTYTYTPTPNQDFTGDDPFTVEISDAGGGFHIHGLALFSPGGGHSVERLVTAHVIEAAATATIPVGENPGDLAVSRDGKRVYVVNYLDGTVSVIDTDTNTVINTFTLSTNTRGLTLSPDSTIAYVSNTGSGPVGPDFVAVMNTTTGTFTTIAVGIGPNDLAVNSTGTVVYVANGLGDTVSVIDTGSNTVIKTIPVGDNPEGVSFSPDGSVAYVANFDDDSVSVIDTGSHTVIKTISVGDGADVVAFSPDGTRAYVTNFNDGSVSVIDTSSHTVITIVPVGDIVIGVAVSPDGSAVYVNNLVAGNVSVIDTASNTVIDTIPVGTGPALVAFSPDGTHAYVTNSVDDTVSVISVV